MRLLSTRGLSAPVDAPEAVLRGIAPDGLEKVKQKFFKAKNSVRGSGIGLAVVDEIVGTLGGKFDIASTLGQGTTVTVTLPVYHPGQEHLHDKI